MEGLFSALGMGGVSRSVSQGICGDEDGWMGREDGLSWVSLFRLVLHTHIHVRTHTHERRPSINKESIFSLYPLSPLLLFIYSSIRSYGKLYGDLPSGPNVLIKLWVLGQHYGLLGPWIYFNISLASSSSPSLFSSVPPSSSWSTFTKCHLDVK